ncbi:MAG: hypothetical protein JXR87_09030 [Candidatus Marinimicrobia bacterium]|nr:hypothetical protein [Candidatus Neomarinimicrobiota bacterium]
MICVSFSEESVRYGQLIKNGEDYVIETVQKFPLSIPFLPENVSNPQFGKSLEKAFLDIRSNLPKPDSYVAVTLPAIWFDISSQSIDTGLSEENLEEALNWKISKRLGAVVDQKFVQHYPLSKKSGSEQSYLTISYFKELGKLLLIASQSADLNIHIMDIDLFSAALAIEQLEDIGKHEKWAIWLVGEQVHDLIVIDSGDFRQLCRFNFSDMENYTILHKSSADDIGEKVIADINGIRTFELENFSAVDRIYFYSYSVDSEFFNMLLTYDIDNLKNIDTFEKHKPLDLYQEDGSGTGAMCQYIDLLGLMFRKMPKELR